MTPFKKKRSRCFAGIIAIGALGATYATPRAAWAQTQGAAVLTGRVIDTSSKAPLNDGVVTVTSPALQGEQTVVTDSAGFFRVPALPPGDYMIRVDRDGYRPFSRGGIALRINTTIRVDVELLPENLQAAEVTVVARPPTVDVGSTQSGVSLTSEFTNRVPVAPPGGKGGNARSFEQLGEVAPTGRSDAYGTSIRGTTSPENGYFIDGMSVSNTGLGLLGTPLSIEFIKEANIVTGGYLPEYGRAGGGVFDVVTKSGSNEVHGTVFGYVTPFEAKRTLIPRQGNAITTETRLTSVRDIGFDVGAPIVKDKLWFYGGLDISRSTYTYNRNLNAFDTDPTTGLTAIDPATGLQTSHRIAGTSRDYRVEGMQLQYIAKVDYAHDQNNHFMLTTRGTPSWSGGNGAFDIDPETGGPTLGNVGGNPRALGVQRRAAGYDLVGKWTNASNNKSLLFDTTVGWHHQTSSTLPTDGSSIGGGGLAGIGEVSYARTRSPGRHSIGEFETLPDASVCADAPGVYAAKGAQRCPIQNYVAGGPGYLDDVVMNRYQGREVMTYLAQAAGHHVFKAGVDIELTSFDRRRAYSGRAVYQENSSGTSFGESRQYGYLTGPDQAVVLDSLRWKVSSTNLGGFIQDSWNILDKVTVNAGFRYDAQYLYNNANNIAMSLPQQWSPRIGVIYDPTQEGRSKIFGSYARYYQGIPLNIADRAGSGDPQVQSGHKASGCNPADPAQQTGACQQESNRRGYYTPVNDVSDPSRKWGVIGAGRSVIDPDIKPQSQDEFTVGGEYEIFPQGRLGTTYIRTRMNNIIEDMSRDEAQSYFIGNPGSGIAREFPKAERNYDAGVVYFQKLFGDSWLAQASYTMSWLRGNWAGFYRPETLQLDPGSNSDFDLKSLTINRTGDLPGDHRHELKFFGAKDWALPGQQFVETGLAYRARSGGPTNYLGRHILYGPDEVMILPRGSGDRLSWQHSIDLHLGYGIAQTKDSSVRLTMDVFNLFNFQAVAGVDQRYTNASVNPIAGGNRASLTNGGLTTTEANAAGKYEFDPAQKNPNFGKPTAYQDPLTIRFGVKATF